MRVRLRRSDGRWWLGGLLLLGLLAPPLVFSGGRIAAPHSREVGSAGQADEIAGLERRTAGGAVHRHDTSPAYTPARSSAELN
jgi:hypothetical protein